MKWVLLVAIAVISTAPNKTNELEDDRLYQVYSSVCPVITAKRINPLEVKDLARIIYAEGSACTSDYEAIGHVVMVRAAYKKQSIYKTIRRPGQFDGLYTKRWYSKPSDRAYEAARTALAGELWDIYPCNMYYFHNPRTSTDTKWVRYIEQYPIQMIGQHQFCANPKMRV